MGNEKDFTPKRHKYSNDDIRSALIKHDGNVVAAAKDLGIAKSTLYEWIQKEEVLEQWAKTFKQKQKLQDQNRITNKYLRETIRRENAVAEYVLALVEVIDKNNLASLTKYHKTGKRITGVGLVQLSDLHLNEIVQGLVGNEYDWDVAAARFKLFATMIIKTFRAHRIIDIVLALTGDLLNSDRRMDELLENSVNRAQGTWLAIDLLQLFLLELNGAGFNVTVASVSGNESRIDKDRGWPKKLATNNFDFMIHEALERLFKGAKGITFLECNEAPTERVINLAGHNVLMLHGDNKLAGNPEAEVQKIIGKWAGKGIEVSYVIFGHLHCALASDKFSRSSSMVGANAFSDHRLNLHSRASQNCYIFWANGNHNAYVIDLQNTKHIKGYPANPKLKAYAAKSAEKCREEVTIIRITV